jgi:hypothetical protein
MNSIRIAVTEQSGDEYEDGRSNGKNNQYDQRHGAGNSCPAPDRSGVVLELQSRSLDVSRMVLSMPAWSVEQHRSSILSVFSMTY